MVQQNFLVSFAKMDKDGIICSSPFFLLSDLCYCNLLQPCSILQGAWSKRENLLIPLWGVRFRQRLCEWVLQCNILALFFLSLAVQSWLCEWDRLLYGLFPSFCLDLIPSLSLSIRVMVIYDYCFLQAESVVNAGPSVYISPLGPNPIMVQVC